MREDKWCRASENQFLVILFSSCAVLDKFTWILSSVLSSLKRHDSSKIKRSNKCEKIKSIKRANKCERSNKCSKDLTNVEKIKRSKMWTHFINNIIFTNTFWLSLLMNLNICTLFKIFISKQGLHLPSVD